MVGRGGRVRLDDLEIMLILLHHTIKRQGIRGWKNFNQSCVNTARLSISCEGRSSLIASSKNNRLIANEARRKINLTKATFGDCVT